MVKETERRKMEQLAAWEKMERKDRQREVDTGQASADGERFITDAYKKQMELEKQGRAAEEIEAQLNE
jgi:hypothetical protein